VAQIGMYVEIGGAPPERVMPQRSTKWPIVDFINRDPIQESGGVNLYAFVANNPVSGFDVLGLNGRGHVRTVDRMYWPNHYTSPQAAPAAPAFAWAQSVTSAACSCAPETVLRLLECDPAGGGLCAQGRARSGAPLRPAPPASRISSAKAPELRVAVRRELHGEYEALREDISASGETGLDNPQQHLLDRDATLLPSTPDQSGAVAPSVAIPDNL